MADVYTAKSESLVAVADAIRTKTGKSAKMSFPEGFVSEISEIETGGGGTAKESDINFFDYDGTLLYSYTTTEALELTELPAGPTHDGLTFQGWNWTLAQIQQYGVADIGPYFVATDGATHFFVEVTEYTLTIRLQHTATGSAVIDWGDGETDTIDSSTTYTDHTYASAGDYEIKVDCEDGTIAFESYIFSVPDDVSAYPNVGAMLLKKILCGRNVDSIEPYCSYDLACIAVAEGVTIGNMSSCKSLPFCVCGETPPSALSYCSALHHLAVAPGSGKFWSCSSTYSLRRLVLCGTPVVAALSMNGSSVRDVYILTSDETISLTSSAFEACVFLHEIKTAAIIKLAYGCFKGAGLRSFIVDAVNTTIPGNTFYGSYQLQEVTAEGGLTEISANAFQSSSIRQAIFRGQVDTIKGYAFASCVKLALLDLSACTSVPTLAATNAIKAHDGLTIKVPASLYDTWIEATNWATFADYIVSA